MYPTSRQLLLPLLCGVGCVALNPAYEDSASSNGGSGGGGSSSSGGLDTSGGVASGTSMVTGATEGSTTTDGPASRVEFIDEAWDGQFGAGEETADFGWVEQSLQLVDADAGKFRSRVFDSEAAGTRWESLDWAPLAAYGVPLPAASEWDADEYERGSISAQRLSLLLAFERDSAWSPGQLVHDDSPFANHGRWTGEVSVRPSEGVFGTAFPNPDMAGGQRVDFADFRAPAEDEFTWTLWFRADTCPQWSTLIALDSPTDVGGSTLAFIGCDYLDPQGAGMDGCTGDANADYAVAWLQGPGGSVVRGCNPVRLDDGAWHFIAVRRRIEGEDQRLDIFVDESEPTVAPADPADADTGITDVAPHRRFGSGAETFTVAGGNAPANAEPPFPGYGEYDQVALWNRRLTDAEIQSLHLRGRTRVVLQVRACDQADCSDAEFVGPDADAARVFVDPGGDHTVDLAPLGLQGRYFQYRLKMQGRVGLPSPAITRVRAIGRLD